MRKIYITGCARSGTTLLARLFNAFEDTYVINEEVSVTDFCNPLAGVDQYKFVVGKRTEYTIFGNVLSTDEKKRQLDLLHQEDVFIINCVRDGRDVVAGWDKAWGVYNPFVWMQSIMDSKAYESRIGMTIRYEELLNNPYEVQVDIMSALGLEPKFSFAAYPMFVPEECFQDKGTNHHLRPLEAYKPSKSEVYKKPPNNVQYFEYLLKELGYVWD